MTDSAYESMRRVTYDCGDSIGVATFVPVCETCGRFVKSHDTLSVSDYGLSVRCLGDKWWIPPNAECSRCGPTHMLFEGFM